MKILLQMYLNENLGDDLFIDVIAKRYPDIDFIIYGIGNRKISSIYDGKYKNVKILQRKTILRKLNLIAKIILKRDFILENELKKCDGMITLGGSVFLDSPLLKEAIKSRILANVRLNALSIGKPTFVIGANFGPIYHDKHLEKYYEYFSKCVSVCFRDEKSKEYFKELKNVSSSTDVVFNYKRKKIKIKKDSIGISLIDLEDKSHSKIAQYANNYEKKMVEIIDKLIDENYNINIYSFCNNQGDHIVSKRIVDKLKNKSNVKILEYKDFNLDEFINDFSSNEYIIATRFHGMILGLIQQQKVFPIVYDIKTQNVIDELKIDKYSTLENIETLNIKDILHSKSIVNIDKIKNDSKRQFSNFEKYFKLREGQDESEKDKS